MLWFRYGILRNVVIKASCHVKKFWRETHEPSTLAFITSLYSQNYANESEDYRRDCHVVFSEKKIVVVIFKFQPAVKIWQAKRIIPFFCNISVCNWRWSCLCVSVFGHQHLREIQLWTLWSTLNITYFPCNKHVNINLFPAYCTSSYIKAITSCFGHTCYTTVIQFQYNIVLGK
jgi:hypothetical protein